jgi:hypothetical protein
MHNPFRCIKAKLKFCTRNIFITLSSKSETVKPMQHKVTDKATSDKISFIAYIVPAFADAYKMNVYHNTPYLSALFCNRIKTGLSSGFI